jgi:hypothetical protein
MSGADQTTVIAGLDGRREASLPDWFAAQHPDAEPVTFTRAIRELPRATTTAVAYRNPYSGEWSQTDQHVALVEPSRLVAEAEADGDDGGPDESPLFHVPTDSYAVLNPTDVFGPVTELLAETEIDGRALGEVLFGEIRQYRGGGEVHMDLMFDGLQADLPDRNDPITMGVTTGYDFFGGHAVYVEGFARDTACANSIRAITEREAIRHVGDVDDLREWWEARFEQLDLLAEDLLDCIAAAQDVTLDVGDLPFDLEAFYELLGFPAYLAEHAAQDARANAADIREPTLWVLHSGATYALTHQFRGGDGSALQQYTRLANDLLFNPEATIDRVEAAYERELEGDTEGQQSLDGSTARVQLEQVREDLAAKADQFEQREERLRERFAVGESG